MPKQHIIRYCDSTDKQIILGYLEDLCEVDTILENPARRVRLHDLADFCDLHPLRGLGGAITLATAKRVCHKRSIENSTTNDKEMQ